MQRFVLRPRLFLAQQQIAQRAHFVAVDQQPQQRRTHVGRVRHQRQCGAEVGEGEIAASGRLMPLRAHLQEQRHALGLGQLCSAHVADDAADVLRPAGEHVEVERAHQPGCVAVTAPAALGLARRRQRRDVGQQLDQVGQLEGV